MPESERPYSKNGITETGFFVVLLLVESIADYPYNMSPYLGH
jgi:hypothetical protein